MDVKEFLEALGNLENGTELVEFFNSHSKKLSDEAGDNRKAKSEAKQKAEGLEKTLTELLSAVQASDKDDALSKITGFETKLSELADQLSAISKENEENKAAKEKSALNTSILEALTEKNIEDKNGFIRDAMTLRATKGENGYTIGEQSFSDFLQSQIDSKDPTFRVKNETPEIPPEQNNTKNDNAIREIMGLPPKE